MAKKSAIQKNLNKEKQVKKNKSRRARLKAICSNRSLSMEERSGKFAAMAKKRGLPAEEKTEMEEKNQKKEKEAEVAPVIYVLDSKGRRVKVIDDDSEE